MSNVIIRRFQPGDRNAIRTICCDTADRGGPVESILCDRDCAADLLTAYYTDYDPLSVFVAEDQGKVVGYVQGCMDNRRYGLVMFWFIVPKVFFKCLRQGLLFSRQFWRTVMAMMRNYPRLFMWRKESFHSHQGHVHIGIAEDYRGRHIGKRLMEQILHHARDTGVEELAASVHDANKNACGFFESMDFRVRGRYPMVQARVGKEGVERYHSVLYVKKIF